MRADSLAIDLTVTIAITDGSSRDDDELSSFRENVTTEKERQLPVEEVTSMEEIKSEDTKDHFNIATRQRSHFLSRSTGFVDHGCGSQPDPQGTNYTILEVEEEHAENHSRQINYSVGRPSISDFIRMPVEMTGGETAVVVCGGKSLISTVGNFVAKLSNERAAHKGTGAQGIYLYTEEYCL